MRWFYNLKIATKLITGFIVVALIAGAVGFTGISNIKKIESLDTKLYEMMTVPLGEMVNYVEAYQRMRGNVKDIILSTNQEQINDYQSRIKDRNAEFDKNLESFGATLLTEEGKVLTKELKNNKKQYDLIVNDIIKLVKENKRNQAMLLMNGNAEKIRSEMEKAYRRMMDIKVAAAKTTESNNNKTAKNATILMMVFILVGMTLAIVLGIIIANIISKPIGKVVGVANKIADGDLDINIEVKTKDEVGLLAKAFEKMVENLNEAMGNINSSSEQVATGSRQVSISGQALSQGSTEQASSIEEITSSMTQVAAQTKENAANANQANELAIVAKNNAVSGNQQMQEMLKAMAEINDSSSNISKIIKVIDEIAFQTNILALNAAVEAARAGQHGKGFAVVAEEVRNLAARSANAAKETTTMIEGSIKKVDMGTKIANETAQALNKIVEDVAKAAQLVAGIAGASSEQATGIAQVNVAIEQVAQVVQTNSATAEESAAASEELSGQAELLKQVVSKFKLKKTSNSTTVGLDKLTPEIRRAIESMMEKKNNFHSDSRSMLEAAPTSYNSKLRIDLSDKEFGKY
jgi:methyl-accepting chemotaxis protein